jgi:Ran GTPase-activating protein (RanGAP) involved in mRNA processing and transport
MQLFYWQQNQVKKSHGNKMRSGVLVRSANPVCEEIRLAATKGATLSDIRTLFSFLTGGAGTKKLGENVTGVLDDELIIRHGITSYAPFYYMEHNVITSQREKVVLAAPPGTIGIRILNAAEFLFSPKLFSCPSICRVELGYGTTAQVKGVIEILCQEGNFPNVEELCWDRVSCNEEAVFFTERIASGRALPQLKSLNLDEAFSGNETAAACARILSREDVFPLLQRLVLSDDRERVDGDGIVAAFTEAFDREGAFPNLQSLDISRNRRDWTPLFSVSSCKGVPSLRQLIFTGSCPGNNTEKPVAETLAAALHRNLLPGLRDLKLNLNHCELLSDGITVLAPALCTLSFLCKLDIRWNSIDDEGMLALANVLGNNRYFRSLRELDVSNNTIGPKGAMHLAKAFRQPGAVPSLRVLNLCQTDIDDEGASALADTLKVAGAVPFLLDLNLTDSLIGPDGAKALATALVQSGATRCLQVFNIGFNNIEGAGAIALADAVRVCSTLKELYLDRNDIDDAGADALGQALGEKNTFLQHISLKYNNIGTDGIKALAPALGKLPMLTSLSLSSNPVGDEGVAALMSAARREGAFLVLNEICLDHCDISSEGTTILATTLEIQSLLPSLRRVTMFCNEAIDKVGRTALKAAEIKRRSGADRFEIYTG